MAARRTGPATIPGSQPPAGRFETRAEARARHRAGREAGLVWSEARNGLPVGKPYTRQRARGNCLTCELWLGCGGAFCSKPIQRKAGA